MSLWRKTLLVILLSVGILGLTLYGIQRFLILRSFASLENRYTQLDVQRAQRALSAEAQRLGELTRNWTGSEALYAYVRERDVQYARSQLSDQAMLDARVNFLLITDAAARIVFARALDLNTHKALLLPEFAQEALSPQHPLLDLADEEGHREGVWMLASTPMIVAARSIVGDEAAAPGGTLVVGRVIDAALVQEWSDALQRPLALWRSDDPALPVDFRRAQTKLSVSVSLYVTPLDDVRVAGYGQFNDLLGNPALILRVILPRDIYAFGLASFRYLVAAIILVGVQFWGVSVLLIERTVLSRVSELGRQVNRVGQTADLERRVALAGQDEVGKLAAQINGMLEDLQRARESIRWRERYLEALTQAEQSLLTLGPDIPYTDFLRPLGEATQASRVYVFLNQRGLAGDLLTSIKAEWCAPGVPSLLERAELHNLPLVMSGLQRWVKRMTRGKAVSGVVADLPTAEQMLLETLGIRAIMALPLMLDDAWVGWIAFDQCGMARVWQTAEVDLMRGAAVGLAQALRRERYAKVQSVTYRVSEAAHTAQALPEFFHAIHVILGELMPAKGLFIALTNPRTQALEFSYVVEEGEVLPEPRGLGCKLAEYVLQTGEPLLLPRDVLEKLRPPGETAEGELPAVYWLGVPLRAQERTVGVLAVQSYAAGEYLGGEEKDILTFVATQVAMAVERTWGRT